MWRTACLVSLSLPVRKSIHSWSTFRLTDSRIVDDRDADVVLNLSPRLRQETSQKLLRPHRNTFSNISDIFALHIIFPTLEEQISSLNAFQFSWFCVHHPAISQFRPTFRVTYNAGSTAVLDSVVCSVVFCMFACVDAQQLVLKGVVRFG